MTAVADVTASLEALLGRVLSAQQLQTLANAIMDRDPANLLPRPNAPGPHPFFADPQNPTNEEKAELVKQTILSSLRRTIRDSAEDIQRTTNETSVSAAGDAAVADLE